MSSEEDEIFWGEVTEKEKSKMKIYSRRTTLPSSIRTCKRIIINGFNEAIDVLEDSLENLFITETQNSTVKESLGGMNSKKNDEQREDISRNEEKEYDDEKHNFDENNDITSVKESPLGAAGGNFIKEADVSAGQDSQSEIGIGPPNQFEHNCSLSRNFSTDSLDLSDSSGYANCSMSSKSTFFETASEFPDASDTTSSYFSVQCDNVTVRKYNNQRLPTYSVEEIHFPALTAPLEDEESESSTSELDFKKNYVGPINQAEIHELDGRTSEVSLLKDFPASHIAREDLIHRTTCAVDLQMNLAVLSAPDEVTETVITTCEINLKKNDEQMEDISRNEEDDENEHDDDEKENKGCQTSFWYIPLHSNNNPLPVSPTIPKQPLSPTISFQPPLSKPDDQLFKTPIARQLRPPKVFAASLNRPVFKTPQTSTVLKSFNSEPPKNVTVDGQSRIRKFQTKIKKYSVISPVAKYINDSPVTLIRNVRSKSICESLKLRSPKPTSTSKIPRPQFNPYRDTNPLGYRR